MLWRGLLAAAAVAPAVNAAATLRFSCSQLGMLSIKKNSADSSLRNHERAITDPNGF